MYSIFTYSVYIYWAHQQQGSKPGVLSSATDFWHLDFFRLETLTSKLTFFEAHTLGWRPKVLHDSKCLRVSCSSQFDSLFYQASLTLKPLFTYLCIFHCINTLNPEPYEALNPLLNRGHIPLESNLLDF